MRKVPVLVRPVDSNFKVWQGFGEIRLETTWAYAEFDGQHSGVDFYMPAGNKVRCSLKEMVFEPVFEKPIRQWREMFTYWINNQNTVKTWRFLALRYLGDEDRWTKVREMNQELMNIKENDVLEEETEVVIPNFS